MSPPSVSRTLSVSVSIAGATAGVVAWIGCAADLWIVVDILAIGLFIKKGLQPTAALYAVFLVLATIGLFTWIAARNEQKLQPAHAS